MLEKVMPESPRLWKKDLEQIKSLGFNAGLYGAAKLAWDRIGRS